MAEIRRSKAMTLKRYSAAILSRPLRWPFTLSNAAGSSTVAVAFSSTLRYCLSMRSAIARTFLCACEILSSSHIIESIHSRNSSVILIHLPPARVDATWSSRNPMCRGRLQVLTPALVTWRSPFQEAEYAYFAILQGDNACIPSAARQLSHASLWPQQSLDASSHAAPILLVLSHVISAQIRPLVYLDSQLTDAVKYAAIASINDFTTVATNLSWAMKQLPQQLPQLLVLSFELVVL